MIIKIAIKWIILINGQFTYAFMLTYAVLMLGKTRAHPQ